jgi:hypothetical protein
MSGGDLDGHSQNLADVVRGLRCKACPGVLEISGEAGLAARRASRQYRARSWRDA